MSLNNSNTGQAFWLVLGSLSTMAISIVSAMVLSRYFEKAEYGTYRQILFVYNSFLVVFSAGLPKVFAYFLPRIDKSEGKELVNRITKLLFFLGLLFGGFLYLTSGWISIALNNPALDSLLELFAIVPVLLLPTLGVQGIFTTYKKSVYVTIYNSISRIILLLCIILPVIYMHNSVYYAVYGWIVGSLISLALALFFKNIPFKMHDAVKSTFSTKEILTYSFPLVLASLSGIAIKAADQFYISRYFGEEVFAEFSNGFTPLPFVGMVSASAASVLMPVFSGLSQNKENVGKIATVFKSTVLKSSLIIYPIVIFCFVHADIAITLLYSDIYANSVTYFRLFLILHLFNIIVFSPVLFALNETKFYAKLHLYSAILVWIMGFIVIVVYPNPYIIAALSILFTIGRVVVATFKTSNVLNLSFLSLVPVGHLCKIVLHSIVVIVLFKMILDKILSVNDFLYLILNGILIAITILLTSKILNLDYLLALRPLLIKASSFIKRFN